MCVKGSWHTVDSILELHNKEDQLFPWLYIYIFSYFSQYKFNFIYIKLSIFFVINNLGQIMRVMIKALAKLSTLALDLFLSTAMQSKKKKHD